MSPLEPNDKLLIFFASSSVIVLALVEAIVLSRRHHYDWRAFGISVLDQVARISLYIVLPFSLATPVMEWASQHRLTTIQLDGWSVALLLFIGQEFCYYWAHRVSHRNRWFWCNHAVHHSPNELNLSAAFRLGVFNNLIGNVLLFCTPLVWLGFDSNAVITVVFLNMFYQLWVHATWVPKLGWIEGIFNTPSAHRVHHASNPEYLDANYGGVLIIFDRLFGTYVQERDDLPCRYGLVHPITSYNPLRVEFTQWINLLRDLATARSIRTAIGYLVMPPGWAPKNEDSTTTDLSVRPCRSEEK